MIQKIEINNSINPINLDIHDKMILDILDVEGRISISQLAKKINLSKTPTQIRVKRLEKQGIIKGYRAIINPTCLGINHVAFVEVTLSDTREKALSMFNDEVIKISEIEQCHMIAGNFDYLLKVRTEDMNVYRKVLGEKISALPYVAHTKTFVTMESVKERM